MNTLLPRLFVVSFASLTCLAPVQGATLTGSVTSIPKNTSVNLSTNGTIDWVHWGLFTESTVNRKAGVNPQIGDFSLLSAGGSNSFTLAFQFSDNENGYTWTDGDPVAGVTNTTTGVWAYGIPSIGTGFELSVPAGTALRTLKVYCGVFAGAGRFTASLSDNSASDYTTSFSNIPGNGPSREVTLHFAAASPDQTLTVRWVLQMPGGSASANVTLQAAALSAEGVNNPPVVRLTSPTEDANIPSGNGSVTVTASASDLDGTVSMVEFYANGTRIGSDNTSPYSISWNTPPPGRYSVTAVATDNDGEETVSVPVDVMIYSTGGSLLGSAADPPSSVNLTTEGTTDWQHWGLSASNLVNHKAGIAPVIDMDTIGTTDVHVYSDNFTSFSWSDGTPTLSAGGVPNGVFVYGRSNGFELVLPAGTTPRTLRVYAGLYGAEGHFQAWLNDFSAAAYHDHSLSNFFGNDYRVFTLTYAAAAEGRSLTVRYTPDRLFDADFGNVTLQAATLSGGGGVTLLPVQIINPVVSGTALSFSFQSVAGRTYDAQWLTTLGGAGWQTFATVPGTGGMVAITNSNTSGTQRFYRVETK